MKLLVLVCTVAVSVAAAESCGQGEVCQAQRRCRSFRRLYNQLKAHEKGSEERKEVIAQLRAKVCDSKLKTVCCEPPTPSATAECADGSCLPGAGHCGLSGGEQRVVGGENTIPGEFPYTALLGHRGEKYCPPELCGDSASREVNVWKCGGTLISRRYVVTAGHCHNVRRGTKDQVGLVRLGEYQVTSDDGLDCVAGKTTCLPPVQDFTIAPADVSVHPDYGAGRGGGTVNDIALIRLPRLAQLNEAVGVACLPTDPVAAAARLNVPDIGQGLAGYYLTVVGWGHTEADPFDRELTGEANQVASPIQQKLGVPVLTVEQCASKFPRLTLLESMICAGGEKDKGSCSGDSGGPLYLKYIIPGEKVSATFSAGGNKPWYLLGIVSFGTSTCGKGKPSIYTRVENFVPWIQSEIKK